MAFNKLNVVIGANVEALQKRVAQGGARLAAFWSKMQRIRTDLTQLVTVPIAGLGAAALKSFSDIERLEKGLITDGFWVKLPPLKWKNFGKSLNDLGFQEAIDGSVRLQAVGFQPTKHGNLVSFRKSRCGVWWNQRRFWRGDLSAYPNDIQG